MLLTTATVTKNIRKKVIQTCFVCIQSYKNEMWKNNERLPIKLKNIKNILWRILCYLKEREMEGVLASFPPYDMFSIWTTTHILLQTKIQFGRQVLGCDIRCIEYLQIYLYCYSFLESHRKNKQGHAFTQDIDRIERSDRKIDEDYKNTLGVSLVKNVFSTATTTLFGWIPLALQALQHQVPLTPLISLLWHWQRRKKKVLSNNVVLKIWQWHPFYSKRGEREKLLCRHYKCL